MYNVFEGQRVRLRAYEPGDGDVLFRHGHDSEIARRDSRIGWPRSRAAIQSQIEDSNQAARNDDKSLLIETLDGHLVGGIDIQSTDPRNGTFSIGIGLSERAAWGKGYAKDAMLLALRHMFHERRYQKCTISAYSFNQRAITFYSRLGFQDEGRLRRVYFTNGSYHDEVFLGITLEEFDARYPEWHLSLEEE